MRRASLTVDRRWRVSSDAEPTARSLTAALALLPRHSVETAAPGVLVVRHRYLPPAAFVAALVSVFVVLFLGLLFLLARRTDTFTVLLEPVDGGTEVTVRGEVSGPALGVLIAELAAAA